MERKKKIILIVSLSLASAIVTYFGGGLIATKIACESMLNVRGSDDSSRDDIYNLIQYQADDYPLLQHRKEISFSYKKETLQGYLYEVNNPKGVIISAHGVNSYADCSHSAYQNYFVRKGWDVFSFDMIGCGKSTGTMTSLAESRFCVEEAIKTVKENEATKDLPICLVGHSWGAYGVVSASGKYQDISAVASFSGYDQPSEVMYGFAINYVSPALAITKPAMTFSLAVLEGDKQFYSAKESIKKNKETSYIIIQGEEDDVVPTKHYSIYSQVNNKQYENVETKLITDCKHSYVWNSPKARKYILDELFPKIEKLENQYNNKIPMSVVEEFIATVDKEKASEIDTDLLDYINNSFITSLKS